MGVNGFPVATSKGRPALGSARTSFFHGMSPEYKALPMTLVASTEAICLRCEREEGVGGDDCWGTMFRSP